MRSPIADTELRGGFPETRASAIAGVSHVERAVRDRSHGAIVTVYWKPVYKYLRLRWGETHEGAQDLTQEFFARAIEKAFFAKFEPEKARFRTYLRTCVDALVANERQAQRRLKRGGGVIAVDFASAQVEVERLPANDATSVETVFDREWMCSVFTIAVEGLHEHFRARGTPEVFEIFAGYDLESGSDPGAPRRTYEEIGRRFGVSTTTVTNHLAAARREFRRIVLEKLREITVTDEEYRLEARALFRNFDPESRPR